MFEPPNAFYRELMAAVPTSRLVELEKVLIEGVLEYDYAHQGLYSVLLVQDKHFLPLSGSKEYLAVMPIQHIRNDQEVLLSVRNKYEIEAVLRSKEAIDNVKRYWQDHLDEFFQ